MKVFLIAGEASGDALGGALMAGLKQLSPGVQFDGVGGPLMQAEGLTSRFEMSELSLMGITEILPKYFHLKRRIRETAEAILTSRPDVVVTIDSPDFCLRVAKRVKAASDIRIVHYVAPSVWAWRPGRAAKMAPLVDQVLALLPFEPPYMEAAGIRCDFVGHPIAGTPQASADAAQDFRARHDVGSAPLVLVLPGSRRGEIARLSGRFGAALGLLAERRPEAVFVLPVAPSVRDQIDEAVAQWPVEPILLDGPAEDKRAAFAAADVALAASGTVSLELAAAGTPMVIAYDLAPLSRMIIGRMLRVDTVTLVNLVSDTRTVPEFIGKACAPGPIAKALLGVLNAPEAQHEAMSVAMQRLGRGGEPPGLRAARAVLDGIQG